MKYLLTCIFGLLAATVFADEKPKAITIATWNVEWFFDDYQGDNRSDLSKKLSAPSKNDWEWKVENVARVIAEMKPTIMALQEIENRQVIRQLTRQLSEKHGMRYRIAYIEGWDNFTEQDVAVIYQSGLVELSFREQTRDMFNSKKYYNLNKHLFTRFQWGEGDDQESLLLLNVHLRAMPDKADLRIKQCKLIREWIAEHASSETNVVVLGDMNTEELTDTINQGSDMAVLAGWESETKSDDLRDLHSFLPNDLRDTHISGKHFDRLFVNRALFEDKKSAVDLSFSRITTLKSLVTVGGQDGENHFDQYYEIPAEQRDISDHYPVVAEFLFK